MDRLTLSRITSDVYRTGALTIRSMWRPFAQIVIGRFIREKRGLQKTGLWRNRSLLWSVVNDLAKILNEWVFYLANAGRGRPVNLVLAGRMEIV